jgi:hypothetical protein
MRTYQRGEDKTIQLAHFQTALVTQNSQGLDPSHHHTSVHRKTGTSETFIWTLLL